MRNEFVAGQTGEEEGEWRQFLSHLFAQSSPGIATTGVLAGLTVAQTATASKSVVIEPGAAVVQDSRLNGARPLVANTAKTLDVLTANPVGSLPRNDLVVFDAATGTRRAIIGTPNAVPTDPTVPALAVGLARLRHAANATTIPNGKIDNLRVMTHLLGPDPAMTPRAVATGMVTVTQPTAGIPAGEAVAFPPGRFKTLPSVQVTPNSSSSAIVSIGVTGVTTDGMTVWVTRSNTSPTALWWTATEM